MHSKPCITNNLQGLCLRPPSDCELTQDSDRKNAHNLGSIACPYTAPPQGKVYVSCNELGVFLREVPRKLGSLDPTKRSRTSLFRHSASRFQLTYTCEPRTQESRKVRRAEPSLCGLHRKSVLCECR